MKHLCDFNHFKRDNSVFSSTQLQFFSSIPHTQKTPQQQQPKVPGTLFYAGEVSWAVVAPVCLSFPCRRSLQYADLRLGMSRSRQCADLWLGQGRFLWRADLQNSIRVASLPHVAKGCWWGRRRCRPGNCPKLPESLSAASGPAAVPPDGKTLLPLCGHEFGNHLGQHLGPATGWSGPGSAIPAPGFWHLAGEAWWADGAIQKSWSNCFQGFHCCRTALNC